MTQPFDKPALRRSARARLAVSLADREYARVVSIEACRRLAAELDRAHARTILAFAALPTELDPAPLARQWLERGGVVCLPRVEWSSQAMSPVRVDAWTPEQWPMDRHGLRSPPPNAPAVAAERLDVVIVPGLAFDALGGRLGRGGGFYDRFLATLPPSCVRAALTLDEQIVASVPMDPWDVPVDLIATPTRVLRTQKPDSA